MCVLFTPIVWFTFQYNFMHYAQFFQELYWVLTQVSHYAPHYATVFRNRYTKLYLLWSNLSSITVFFSWYFMKISRKWTDETSIFSKLQVYESIHEGFSFSVTLKAGFCSMFSFKFFLCRRPVSLKLESYCV